MRRVTYRSILALVLLSTVVAACRDDGGSTATTTTSEPTTSSNGADDDTALDALLLAEADLPAGFTVSTSVDDTITAFCAGEDATAGLQATARAVRGFLREGSGASVIQLAFRFQGEDAATFVAQADAVLGRCSGIPDVTGLAFEYDALTPELDATIAASSDAHTGRHGVNVGSGSLSIDLVVLHRGDIGELVAVLGIDLARAKLDDLARAAFAGVASRL